jgi:putative MATE family efflux protein
MKHSTDALGTEKISRLLISYSLPAIVAMSVSSLYNIIDRIFIGHGVGPMAISGLAITLPLINLAVAFGALVGAGAAALMSIRLGEKKTDEAFHILGNTVMLNLILSSVLSALMLVFLDPILYLFGASDQTIPYARAFMQIILPGNVIWHSYMGLNNIMRASGYPRKAMNTTISTVLVNVALAPLFIFVFKWGIRGAALATVLSQLTGLLITVWHFRDKKHQIHFVRGHFRLRMNIITGIFSVGMSAFILNVCACLIAIFLNRDLVRYGGDFAVGAFGIINSVLMLTAMCVMGINQGMQPIAGYNYGARKPDRVNQVFRYAAIAATIITTTGFILGELFPRQIAHFFTSDETLTGLTVSGMRIIVMLFPLIGFQMVTSNFFQSIGRAKISIILSLSRQVLFLIPALLILPRLFGLSGVWFAMPASDISAAILTVFVLKMEQRKMHARFSMPLNASPETAEAD